MHQQTKKKAPITNYTNMQTHFSTKLILKAGLLAGSLDIICAFVYSYIKRGTYPTTVLKFIAEKVFGEAAFTNTALQNITGLLIHFTIAMFWTFVFFKLYDKIKFMQSNTIITAILYGLFIWLLMNVVLLPAWDKKAFVFNAMPSIISAAILIVAIGLPLSIIARRHYRKS